MTFERLARNVRYAARALARTPAFTLTVVLTLRTESLRGGIR